MVNIFINDPRLKRILRKIETNSASNDIYSSKWHKVVNFLYHNSGLKMAKIAQAGSYAKGTANYKSDLDVIFCTSPDKRKEDVLNQIFNKASNSFGKIASVQKGKKAVHINYIKPKCNLDVVYLLQKQFDNEYKAIKDFKQISTHQQDAIKIVKYAFDRLLGDIIKGYEVEKACIMLNCNQLNTCVSMIVNYFKGRLCDNEYTVDSFLRKMLNNL